MSDFDDEPVVDDSEIVKVATTLLGIIERDRDDLTRIQDYIDGRHDDPYMPANADAEYKMLAKRAVSNWMPLLLGTPAQAMYVDGFRSAKSGPIAAERMTNSPAWDFWQRSRFPARQTQVTRGALGFGITYVVVTKDEEGRARGRALSPLRTAAIFEDPVNDDEPTHALTIVRRPKGDKAGQALLWDDVNEYELTLGSTITVDKTTAHGADENPVTRFSPSVDITGRPIGIVEPMIPLQNRINQSVFDLLVVQTYGAFKVRYATGMAPPIERDPETGEAILDENGNAKPLPINHNAKRFLFAEDPDTEFGTLDETPLKGYIESIDMSVRHLSAISQTPPHHLLGQIANLSAEALTAAETSLSRKIEELRHMLGESWERVFRLAAQIDGTEGGDDYHGEVIWRDMEARSLSQTADALGKMRESLGIPAQGLWPRVPGVTQAELDEWADLVENQDPSLALAGALSRASTIGTSNVPASEAEPIESLAAA